MLLLIGEFEFVVVQKDDEIVEVVGELSDFVV